MSCKFLLTFVFACLACTGCQRTSPASGRTLPCTSQVSFVIQHLLHPGLLPATAESGAYSDPVVPMPCKPLRRTRIDCARTCAGGVFRGGARQGLRAPLLRPIAATANNSAAAAAAADDDSSTPAASLSRRELLASSGTASLATLTMQLAAAGAASAAACDFTATPSGLQFCDVKVTAPSAYECRGCKGPYLAGK